MNSRQKLNSEAEKILNIKLTDEQTEKFVLLADMLIDYNEKVNLTRITDEDEIISKHFVDSLSCVEMFEDTDKKIIDVGTGGGFPGLPLLIYNEKLKITMIDSVDKKLDFVRFAAHELGLDCEVLHARAEELGNDAKYREKFDVCVTRAVANVRMISELCAPFVSVGGKFIMYKGKNYHTELLDGENALKKMKLTVRKTQEYSICDETRALILCEKQERTEKKYPRKFSQIKKNPL